MQQGFIQYYMKILKRYYYFVGISLLVLQAFVLENFLGSLSKGMIFDLLLSGTLYVGIFKAAIWLFEWKFWKLFMKPNYLDGCWYITFEGTRIEEVAVTKNTNKKKPVKYTRYGKLYVNWESPY